MSITACNYGAHDFVHSPCDSKWPAPFGMHFHVCMNCDATYLATGAGPCYACRAEESA